MPYLTVEQCHELGLEPYAVYGGKVHSFRDVYGDPDGPAVAHGTMGYALQLDELKLRQLGAYDDPALERPTAPGMGGGL